MVELLPWIQLHARIPLRHALTLYHLDLLGHILEGHLHLLAVHLDRLRYPRWSVAPGIVER